MKRLAAVLSLSLAVAPLAALAQDREASPAQKRQQARMKNCSEKASAQSLKGEEREKFMSSCLKGEEKTTAQQQKMSACNKQARARSLKGDERKAFMSSCLKG
jgi:psiF repeat